MEDPAPYGNRPIRSYTVYKFEVNPDNPEIFTVHSWVNLTFEEAHILIPKNYYRCGDAIVNSVDFYLVIELKSFEENNCDYYVKRV